jgi:nicotinamidase-related amidase
MKALVVVDMQNDFISGSLKNDMAKSIEPLIKKRIENLDKDTVLLFTTDCHEENYLSTEEGKNLPVSHCIKDTFGFEIADSLKEFSNKDNTFTKPTFGSLELGAYLKKYNFSEVLLVGVCTDICVIANAIIAKTFLPNAHIKVDASLCAGVTLKSHLNAIDAMKMLHIEIINEGKECYR